MKLLLKLVAALFILLIAAVIVIVTVIDPNDFKQQIQDQVKKSINRDLIITGDIGWSLYPLLGFESGQVTVQNSPEFEEKTLLNVQSAAVSINVLPLLSGEFEVGEIMLDGVAFNYITNKDGSTNLDNLKADTTATTTDDTTAKNTVESKEESTSKSLDLSKFVLSGINITNAQVKIIDLQTNETQEAAIKSFALEEFAFDKKSHFSLSSTFKNNQLDANIALEADIFVTTALNNIEVTNLVIESELRSDALPDTKVNSTFTSGLKYQTETNQLDVQAITLNNKLSGSYLNGDIYINSSDISITDNNKVSLGKLILTSSLNGSSLENNKLDTNLRSNLALDIAKKTASIDTFDLKNTVSGNLNGNINATFKELNVNNFEKILITQLKLASELDIPAVSKDKIISTVDSDLNYDLSQEKFNLTALKTKINNIQLDGEFSFIQKAIPIIRYNLKGNVLDLNPYLTKTDEQTNQNETNSEKSEVEAEPDLSFLKNVDVQGVLNVEGIRYEDITIGKITSTTTIKNGKATISPLTANLYDGTLNFEATVDENNGKNQYNMTSSLKNVVLMQLLKDAAKIDILSGTANFNLAANGEGLTASKIKQSVKAKGDFRIVDGELYGINLSQEIRVLKAKIQGKTLSEDKLVKKTDFASLIGDFTVENGVADNQKLTMLSPVIRLDGKGQANIVDKTINYTLGVTPLSKTDETTDYVDLSGISIPLRIKGTFEKPTFSLDTEGALKAQADAVKTVVKEKAQQVVQDKAKDILSGKKVSKEDLKEEAKDLENTLKGLFK
jgi:AsmA protein